MTVNEIAKAISQINPRELADFRAWFEEYDAAQFDLEIERDAQMGRLDSLAEQALSDFRKGNAREL